MSLSDEVLQTLQLVLCCGSYGGVSFHDVKKLVMISQQTP